MRKIALGSPAILHERGRPLAYGTRRGAFHIRRLSHPRAVYFHISGVSDVRRFDNRNVISGGKRRAVMIALVLELCGGVLAFSTVAFLALAWTSNSRPEPEREANAQID